MDACGVGQCVQTGFWLSTNGELDNYGLRQKNTASFVALLADPGSRSATVSLPQGKITLSVTEPTMEGRMLLGEERYG
ncbi:hypothetical protein T265_08535 [Opisthorchis viverrini]|uniref:Uncharacterized protein n=1 Tax=Opisthorchis viverrini TaxID=6198 RepID=A0A074Z8V8_OPIVI|nr:hypothetical protein T265_08535 [Opisthorchis viverrini]KER23641.1 hypothetical protein T265_08535 [Opisthorchis viverrini]